MGRHLIKKKNKAQGTRGKIQVYDESSDGKKNAWKKIQDQKKGGIKEERRKDFC